LYQLSDYAAQGKGRLFNISSTVPAEIFRVNESWKFRESFVALAVNVVRGRCAVFSGHTDNPVIPSPARLQLQKLASQELFIPVRDLNPTGDSRH
jgi:hypothetical protein